ncbi:MAG: AAA domain-containing protein [Bacteroidota bacterium]
MDLLYNRLHHILLNPADKTPAERIRLVLRVYEMVLKMLVSEEQQIFANLFAMEAFVTAELNPPAEIMEPLSGVRRLATTSENTISEEALLASIQGVAQGIAYFFKVPTPKKLSTYWENKQLPTLTASPRQRGKEIAFISLVVQEILPTTENLQGKSFCEVHALDEANQPVVLYLYDHPLGDTVPSSRAFSQARKWLWPYATLHAFHLDHKEGTYHSTSQTRLVVEPDFLVDATELAECFFWANGTIHAHPGIALLRRLLPFQTKAATLTGKVVNDLLDQLLFDPQKPWQEIFANTLRQNVLPVVRIGPEALTKARTQIESLHLPQLRKFAKSHQGQEFQIEPAFYSARYGLQGRLDLMREDRDQPWKKDIYELKSGKSPTSGVKLNHNIQVVSYHLLLKSVFQQKRSGSSAVVYSVDADKTIRNVPVSASDEQHLLMLRNRLVATFRALCQRNFSLLPRVGPQTFGARPPYLDNDLESFAHALKTALSLTRAYVEEFTGFVFREIFAAKVGDAGEDDSRRIGFAALWQEDRPEKAERYALLTDLVYEGRPAPEEKPGELKFSISSSNRLVNTFRRGDIVLLYPQEQPLAPLSHQILKGSLVHIDADCLIVRLRNQQVSLDRFLQHRAWVLEHDFMEAGYADLLRSLFQVLSLPKDQQVLVLGQTAPTFSDTPPPPLPDCSPPLLPQQQRIIQQALSSNDYCLIQGPPGTGKTSVVLARIVEQLIQQTEETVVVLAFTNRAVEEICEKIRAMNFPFIRLGNGSQPEALNKLVTGQKYTYIHELVITNKLWVGTVASFLSRKEDLSGILTLDTLIVDEASQLLEPQLIGACIAFKRFILIGDQNQLPAITIQKERTCRVERASLRDVGIHDFRTSFFERLWNQCSQQGWHQAIHTLTDHFRMHPDIADVINPYYDHQLKAYPHRKQDTTLAVPFFQEFSQRVQFWESRLEPLDKAHTQEAEWVSLMVRHIQQAYGDSFHPAETVGVITPWRAQISQIRTHLSDPIFEDVTIDTVERFQGAERDIILISLAVFDPAQMNMLSSITQYSGIEVDRKLNVALSRARERVVIMGYPPALSSSKHYLQIMQIAQMNGSYLAQDQLKERW